MLAFEMVHSESFLLSKYAERVVVIEKSDRRNHVLPASSSFHFEVINVSCVKITSATRRNHNFYPGQRT